MKKATIGAVLVFVALLAAVLFTREERVSEGVPRLDFVAPEVDQVTTVELAGPTPAVLSKGAAGWRVADPTKPQVTYPADEALVASLLSALAEVKAGDHVTARAERVAELELDAAKGITVTVSGAGGVRASLVFGKAAKAGGWYVKRPSSPDVFTTTARLGALARRDVNGWRLRRLVSLKADELVAIKVRLEGSPLELALKDGVWTLEPAPPAGFRFDAGAAQRLAQELAALSAQGFSADSSESTEVAQVELLAKDGRAVRLGLGAESGGRVPVKVEGDPQVFWLPADVARRLTPKLEDLRDLSLASFEAEKVRRLSLVAGGKRLQLAREAAEWKLVEPKAVPAGFDFDAQQVNTVLARLRQLRATRVDASPAAQAACRRSASVSVALELEGGAASTMRLGGELGPTERCATTSVDALTYAVADSERKWLERGLELFKRAPPPPSFPQGGIQGLEQLPPDIRAKLEAQLRQRAATEGPPPQ